MIQTSVNLNEEKVEVYDTYKQPLNLGTLVASKDTLIKIIVTGIILTAALGTLMKELMPDSFSPYCDAFSSVFGLIASYMEAQKWVSAWLFWIVINAFSIWLYMSRELNVSSILMMVYLVLSIAGFYSWRSKYHLNLRQQL